MFKIEDISKLRAMTDAGFMDCKKALTETNGDMDKAVAWLREKGMSASAKKADRIASNGRLGFYNHMNLGQVGVVVEVNCETDFAAKSERFIELVNNIAMHIAAAKPLYLSKEEVPANVVAAEKEILTTKAKTEGKPANIIEKMVEGGINKYYKEVCLLEQEYVKNPDITVAALVNEATLTIGEKLSVRRFTLYAVGEGMEKRNWAE